MTISDEGLRLRMEIVRLGTDHHARRYPPELRRRILDWVERAKQAGLRERQCSDELGIPTKRFVLWRGQAQVSEPKSLVRVQVGDEPPRSATSVAFVSPTGHRVEGLSLEQATVLLREFS